MNPSTLTVSAAALSPGDADVGARLRRLGAGDLRDFQAYRCDEGLARFQGWSPAPDEQSLAFLEQMAAAPLLAPGAWCQLGIARTGDDRLIGDLGLFLSEDGRQGAFGFTLHRAWQGRGLATAAAREAVAMVFEQTSASSVRAVTDARNAASIRLLERLGMARVGRDAVEFKGERCEELVYSVDRASWRST